jgi:SAM-dependent methyltransferase
MIAQVKRPRALGVVERAARGTLRLVGAPRHLYPDFTRSTQASSLAVEQATVSSLLYERLSADDVAEIEHRVSEKPELRAQLESATPSGLRRQLLLAYGVWLRVPGVIERTGLSPHQPPGEVHAMARGPLAAAGGTYEADLVADAMATVGVEMTVVQAALDLGCSSGRVARVFAAAYPHVKWYGCDPNAPAIAWASAHLSGIEFIVNDDAPPLPLPDDSLDLAYAISVWSHFAPSFGLRWFEEMHRLIRPGGHLVCTMHGLASIGFYAANGLRTPQQLQEVAGALYTHGCWYTREFGEEGDWGVINPDWGTAFVSPEWVLTQLCPRWRVVEFAPGRNQGNQDVYVLQPIRFDPASA